MSKFFAVLDICIAWFNKGIAVLGIAAGVLLTFVNVVLRYVFDSGLSWAGEMTQYLFIWSAFFGAAYGFKKGTHISVTILIEKFPPKVAKYCLLFSHLLTTIFLLFIIVHGIQYLLVLHELDYHSVDLGVPLWVPMLVIPIAFTGATYRSAEKFYELTKTRAEDIVSLQADELAKDSLGVTQGDKK